MTCYEPSRGRGPFETLVKSQDSTSGPQWACEEPTGASTSLDFLVQVQAMHSVIRGALPSRSSATPLGASQKGALPHKAHAAPTHQGPLPLPLPLLPAPALPRPTTAGTGPSGTPGK